jgi:hypothetical protein
MVFGASTKPTDGTAFQTSFDPLTALYADSEATRMDVMGPALSAHCFLGLFREGKPVPT